MTNAGVAPKLLLPHYELPDGGLPKAATADRLLALAPLFVDRLRLPFPERQIAIIADLVAIARGELRIEDRIGTGVGELEFVRARNRIYQAHTRMRSHLREVIVYFGRTGRIPADEAAELLRFVLHVLHRRPRRGALAA